MIKKCEICGREFEAKNSRARFCGGTCRQRNFRHSAYYGELQPPLPNAHLSKEEISSVIQNAHNTATDLSRASLLTTAPLCLSLKRVAKKLEDSLRREGL